MEENQDNLDDLLASLCEGVIDAADFARLEAMLSASPDARKRYIQTMELHAELAYSDGALANMNAPETNEEAATLTGEKTHELLASTVAAPQATEGNDPPVKHRLHWFAKAAMIALLPAAAIGLAWNAGWFTKHEDRGDRSIAVLSASADAKFHPVDGRLKNLEAGRIIDLQQGKADVAFRSGSQMTLGENTAVRIDSPNSATLLNGSLTAFVPPQAVGFTVQAGGFRVVDLGTRFSIQTTGKAGGHVHVEEGAVDVIPDVRLPRVFLSFDADSRLTDPVSDIRARIQGRVTSTPGIVGDGAMTFHNDDHSRVNLGNGGGTFAVSRGLSIEALIIPRWSGRGWSTRTAANPDGKPYDYDQIFRKEDGDRRMVLSFQDDSGANQQIIPIVDPGPCLTFGIHLQGVGYNELDMPLDGQAGRPTLAQLQDGRPHHIVATYDAATGFKAIYVDGTLRFRHRFKPGSLIVSGGDSDAAIGNAPFAGEGFAGVIDEFAFYDVALTPAEVMGHWRNVQAGRNYFGGARLSRGTDGKAIAVIPLHAGQSLRLDGDTRLPVADEPTP